MIEAPKFVLPFDHERGEEETKEGGRGEGGREEEEKGRHFGRGRGEGVEARGSERELLEKNVGRGRCRGERRRGKREEKKEGCQIPIDLIDRHPSFLYLRSQLHPLVSTARKAHNVRVQALARPRPDEKEERERRERWR